ncbi:uncharacterized protein LOC127873411 [Dreissena polymorpha]|uniref:Transcobalamin-like C-terminal domain-containing protein n=1 Tax=Dreissena polymorpha TaxID=45954 RepID=A0A9D4KVD0_DREPO|nr:uncharacterized protein LOC127873411 [Dreissena polymorpha]KAH3846815.1 hypothetical protein DPMN_089122 [Dreissena polymorpha]
MKTARYSLVIVCLMCIIGVHSTAADHIRPIRTFTMTVTNSLKTPMFNNSITLPIRWIRSRLIDYMETAGDIDQSKFKFTVTYFAKLGYFVNAFNDVYSVWNASEKNYWRISNQNGSLNVGVSTYEPQKGDRVVFELVSG